MHRLRHGARRRDRTALTDPVDIVARGYDAIADRFAAWQRQIDDAERRRWTADLLDLLEANARALELGVGAAVESSRALADRTVLTGVDVSAEQLRRARKRLPGATFIRADFTRLELDPDSFDAVVALYVLNHVPQDRLASLLRNVSRWLRGGGLFLASFPTTDNAGWTGEWLGTTMYFAGFEPAVNRRLVEAARLEVRREEQETMVEPEGEVTWQWLLAQKPA